MSSTLSAQSVVRHADDLASVTVDGETVIYEPLSRSFHRLDPIASTVWALLDGATPLDATCRDLAEGFGAAPDVIWGDVEPLVTKLIGDGLAAIVSPNEVPA